MTMTHMCLVNPDENEACGAELRHGQPRKPGYHSLAAGMPAFPALVVEDCLHEVKSLPDTRHPPPMHIPNTAALDTFTSAVPDAN